MFLETLEPAIVHDELNGAIAPEVVQALVEHFSEKGQPDIVERCVVHMDIASLDLNQVIYTLAPYCCFIYTPCFIDSLSIKYSKCTHKHSRHKKCFCIM